MKTCVGSCCNPKYVFEVCAKTPTHGQTHADLHGLSVTASRGALQCRVLAAWPRGSLGRQRRDPGLALQISATGLCFWGSGFGPVWPETEVQD